MTARTPAILGGPAAFPDHLHLLRPTLPSYPDLEAGLRELYTSGMLTKGPILRDYEGLLAEHLGVRHALGVSSCTAGSHARLRPVPRRRGRAAELHLHGDRHGRGVGRPPPGLRRHRPRDVVPEPGRRRGGDHAGHGARDARPPLRQPGRHRGFRRPGPAPRPGDRLRRGPRFRRPARRRAGRPRGPGRRCSARLRPSCSSPARAESSRPTTTRSPSASSSVANTAIRAPTTRSSSASTPACPKRARCSASRASPCSTARRSGATPWPPSTATFSARFRASAFSASARRTARRSRTSRCAYGAAEFGLTRDQVATALAAEGIDTRAYYVPPVHRTQAFAVVGPAFEERLPETAALCGEVLTLPDYGLLADRDRRARGRVYDCPARAGAPGAAGARRVSGGPQSAGLVWVSPLGRRRL